MPTDTERSLLPVRAVWWATVAVGRVLALVLRAWGLNSQEILERLWPLHAVLRRLKCRGVTVSTHGARFVYASDDLINLKIALVGTHEFDTTSFLLAELRPDDVFVDVGANLGYFSLLAGNRLRAGRVVAVEPSPSNLAALRLNLEANPLGNISVVPAPLWSVPDVRLELHVVDRHNLGANSVVGSGSVDGVLASSTLDRVLVVERLSKVDVVKIDVEGAELQVLRGGHRCLTELRPRLVILALDSSLEPERRQAYELVREAGYEEIDPETGRALSRSQPIPRTLTFFRSTSTRSSVSSVDTPTPAS